MCEFPGISLNTPETTNNSSLNFSCSPKGFLSPNNASEILSDRATPLTSSSAFSGSPYFMGNPKNWKKFRSAQVDLSTRCLERTWPFFSSTTIRSGLRFGVPSESNHFWGMKRVASLMDGSFFNSLAVNVVEDGMFRCPQLSPPLSVQRKSNTTLSIFL